MPSGLSDVVSAVCGGGFGAVGSEISCVSSVVGAVSSTGTVSVVGSSVSSALSTLAGGLAYAKSTVGAAAVAVIAAISLAPLITLLIYRLIFSIAVSFLEYANNSVGARCFGAYRTAFDTVVSVYVLSTLVCIIQVIVFMKGGAGIA